MLCPACHKETDDASLFCRVCDAYRPQPEAGTKANVALRLFAHLLDGLVGIAAFVMIAFVSCGLAGVSTAGMAPNAAVETGGALGLGTFFFAFIAYATFLLFFLAQGKTPGKALCGIRVADKRNGSLPGIGRMFLREIVGKFVSGLFLGLGYFWAIFDRDAQAWHDKIAGTVVLKRRTLSAQYSESSSNRTSLGSAAGTPLRPALAPVTLRASVHSACLSCGALLPSDARFCENCAHPVSTERRAGFST